MPDRQTKGSPAWQGTKVGLQGTARRSPPAPLPVIIIEEAEPADFTRRALPWLAATTFLAVLMAMSTAVIPDRSEGPLPMQPIEVALNAGSATSSVDDSGGGGPRSSLSQELELPRPAGAAGVRLGKSVVSPESRPRMQPAGKPREAYTDRIPQPSAQEVLSDLPSLQPADAQPAGQLAWEEGRPRKLLSRRDPQFPVMLGAEGVEVECTARITVSEAGNVTHVEITKSSGYTEIDASVEAALREFLFSQVEGRKDAVATVTFRFRLEKQD
jgi:TonB family protein